MRRIPAIALALIFYDRCGAAFAQEGPSAENVVGALEKLTGVHKGVRRNHSKGVCASGSFQASADAHALSISPLFSGETVPFVGRFSVAGPNPESSDASKSPRGMALQFSLPGGAEHNMALLNIPVFGAATVQSFLERLEVDIPDPATGKRDPEKLKAYLAGHPDAKPLSEWFATHNPPPSYAETTYNSLHAFAFIDGTKTTHWVKWRFEPRDGAKFLDDAEMASAPKNFLAQKLVERLQAGPAVWDMIVTVGEASDPLENPTIAWPATRREVKFGVLTVNATTGDGSGPCDAINFDPNLLSNGVEASPDKILAFRSLAYGVSYGRRLEEKQP
jgi:catalase